MMPASAVPLRFIAWWDRFCRRSNPVALIVLTCALLSLPLVFFRGFNSDEGVAVTIARTAVEDGYWLTPHLFNVRFVERPTLLSWVIAAISAPFGNVSQLTARLPIVLSLLAGCLLIYTLLRKVSATIPAALLGVALFLACPIVVRSYVMATADLPLAVLLFSAFVLWWNGYSTGPIGFGRWISIGAVLALAGLMKGPQPIAYFALGIGVFVLGTRSWTQMAGLVLAGMICVAPMAAWYWYVYVPGDETEWAAFMRLNPGVELSGPIEAVARLLSQTASALVLAGAFLVSDRFRGAGPAPPAFVKAISSYAFVAALVILFWPGGSAGRYFYPMILPTCVLGGLAYDALATRRPRFVALLLTLTLCILGYALAYSMLSPLLPARFRVAQLDAARITDFVKAAPATIYRTGPTGINVFPYVPERVLNVAPAELQTIRGPAWLAVPVDEAEALVAQRPNQLRIVMSFGTDDEWRLVRVEN